MQTNSKEIFRVVMNHEQQYSIWPHFKAIPAGWSDTGKSGEKQTCLDHINDVWTDLRPLSVRQQLDNAASEHYQKSASI